MNKPWTSSEIDLLKTTYPILTLKEVVSFFPDRTLDAITWKGRRLGLKRPELSVVVSLPTISDMDAAYFAGFFDGEGNINIARRSHKGKYGRNLYYTLTVRCSNNCPVPLKYFKEVFGGSLKERKARQGNLPHYVWCVQARWAAATLKVLIPYLKIKQHQAELALEFQKRLRPTGKRTRFISEPLSAVELAIRERIREEMVVDIRTFSSRQKSATSRLKDI